MAYAKKVYFRRRRASRFRRRAWRRRYRRYNYRRRYRRTRRSRPEYKRKEFRLNPTFYIETRAVNNQNLTNVVPGFYDFVCIGCENAENLPIKCVPLRQGTNVDQRIGAKIRPLPIRLFGTISIETEAQPDGINQTGLTSVANVNACMLRMMVIQIRNGNTDYNPLGNMFSGINPSVVASSNVPNVGDVRVTSYNGQPQNWFSETSWFSKMFTTSIEFQYDEQYNLENNALNVTEGVRIADRYNWGIFAKAPFRSGIGASVKILKDKLYHLNPTTAPTFGFRCKTKRPYRMVWKESRQNDNELTENCKNPIYIIFIPIYPVGINISKICVNCNVQFYYSDK